MRVPETTIATDVDAVIGRFFAQRIERADARGARHGEIWRRAAEATNGGKRLRPRLLLLAHEALGGGDSRSAETAAAAFELLHTALLLHDDLLDGDLVRRGRPNLAGRFAASAVDEGVAPEAATAWGEASALLAGDVLLSGVHSLIAEIEHSARAALHALVDDCLAVTASGEHSDVGYALGVLRADEHEILRMMEQKTACYSFSAPLRAGALLAGADARTVSGLGGIGASLGLLYQMRDDVIGVFGAETRSGKTVIGDLREGKRTLLIAFAEHSAQWAQVRHLFGRTRLDLADAGRLRAALISSGAADRMQQTIAEQLDRVQREIDEAPLPDPLRGALRRIAVDCAGRDA
ncbi:polyprenyl synthetase family protein [Microbacterium sp. NPDC058342]|uniref:polyprenyl synthetase family protein n=1 Tax=Microbacterium sp. NPDC058342 TaxID=3346454 RepID=UPI003660CA61